MLIRCARNRRWLLYPSLLVWWLWSSMAMCHAQSVPLPAVPANAGAMAMHDHADSAARHTEHSMAAASHDCCVDAALDPCCGPADVLSAKSGLDVDLQFFVVALGWLLRVTEPVSAIFPTVDTVASHAVLPRLHLLFSVFLD